MLSLNHSYPGTEALQELSEDDATLLATIAQRFQPTFIQNRPNQNSEHEHDWTIELFEALSILSSLNNVHMGQIQVSCVHQDAELRTNNTCSNAYRKVSNCTVQPILQSDSKFIHLDSFNTGYAIESTFIAPDKGVSLNLLSAKGVDVVRHLDVCYDWSADQNTLILNGFSEGYWGSEERPSGFTFTPGIPVTVKVEAQETSFRILCNGAEVARNQYRAGLPVSLVRDIWWWFDDTGASQKAEPLSVHFTQYTGASKSSTNTSSMLLLLFCCCYVFCGLSNVC